MISSDSYGVFNIVAKMAGLEVEQMTLELDDLLERRYNNIETLELDQVTLGVSKKTIVFFFFCFWFLTFCIKDMTIFLINAHFLKVIFLSSLFTSRFTFLLRRERRNKKKIFLHFLSVCCAWILPS
jgi:hypothetical protein